MNAKREQAIVGVFVIVVATLLVATVFALGGAFGRKTKMYHAHFPFAGGIGPGATVRYAGGPKVGRVEQLSVDPKNPALIDVSFSVQLDLPVKTSSRVKIMSMSPLGDNHLEILPGAAQAAAAPDGSLLPSDDYVDFNALTARLNDIAPKAEQLLGTLNDRAADLKETVNRVNDALSRQNRENLSATLANARGVIEENRPSLKSTMRNVNDVSAKLGPLLDDFRKTSAEANQTLTHIDAVIGENRPDVRQAVSDLRKSLSTTVDLTGRLDQTLDVNSENLDEMLDNLRHVTENLKEFTEKIKTRPYLLIRPSNPREHRPGQPQ